MSVIYSVVLMLVGLSVSASAFLVLMLIGSAAVRRYPDPADPRRNAPSYTRPATIVLFVFVAGLACILGAIITFVFHI